MPSQYTSTLGFWMFLIYALISMILILVESDQSNYHKIPNQSNSLFQKENFSLFEGSKTGPTVITWLPLSRNIDFCGDSKC